MEYENLKTPQFVDFTSLETFNIDDGADGLFGKFSFNELLVIKITWYTF